MKKLRLALSPLLLGLASCGASPVGESAAKPTPAAAPFTVTEVARFKEPWAIAFLPGTPYALVTEQAGKLKLWEEGGEVVDVLGVPPVAYGGQGGLGDVVLAPDFASTGAIYLSWAETDDLGSGSGAGADTRGAVVAKARLDLEHFAPRLADLQVIWRQTPKVTGRGHYSHRMAFSPDGKYLFVASGERQKFTPAQDMAQNLGKIVRLLPDGTPAPGNPFAAQGGIAAQVWTLGHRNILGIKFDAQGRLWETEHGPAGGDEIDLVEPGKNYGWPLVSEGDHYDGRDIPPHASRPDLAAPAVSWNPVIGPGDFIFYRGDKFPAWRGQAIIAGLVSQGLVRVAIDGAKAREVARYPLGQRIRAIAEREDGTIWLLEDDPGGRLLKLTPK
ncbi:MAG: PQQ-dependent sugar dehydrogenase [Novosphingobium sp.]